MFCIDTVKDETRLWVDSGVPRRLAVVYDLNLLDYAVWRQWSDLVVWRVVASWLAARWDEQCCRQIVDSRALQWHFECTAYLKVLKMQPLKTRTVKRCGSATIVWKWIWPTKQY